MGAASAIIFCAFGSAYGTAKSGCGIAAMAVMKPELIVKSLVPIIMAGILAIYGLIVGAVIASRMDYRSYSLFRGLTDLGGGLAVGVTSVAAGFAIGVVGDAGVRGSAHQPRLFVGMLVILIFAEVLGLYGTIIALLLITRDAPLCTP
ncbi:hypothetical protein ACOME3_007978 [Neoechinorhynchus agilis]